MDAATVGTGARGLQSPEAAARHSPRQYALHVPYSPELNPVENIWEFLRQNDLGNRVYATYEAIVDACCVAWNKLTAAPDRIRSIATRAWAKTVSS